MRFLLVISFLFSFSALASNNCSLRVSAAQDMVDHNGTVEDEQRFLSAATTALTTCARLADTRRFQGLSSSMRSMRSKCDLAANQGQSDLYKGNCYLKVADLANFILGY